MWGKHLPQLIPRAEKTMVLRQMDAATFCFRCDGYLGQPQISIDARSMFIGQKWGYEQALRTR